MSFYRELSRRNVFRVGIAYLVASWVILQIVDVVAPILGLPEWAPRLIFVILAVGLIPALLFSWAYELTPEGLRRDKDVDPDSSIVHSTGRKLNVVIIGLLAIAIGLLLINNLQGPSLPAEPGAAPVAAGSPGATSIAVLPFVNMSDDDDHFADGVTEEILNSLASVTELKVAGRTSSFAFKNQNDDLRRIGDALGVEHILEGSVRKAGEQVRITAQLIKVDDGFHLWSETYDRELDDIFAIQEEIANEILRNLKGELLPGEAAEVVVAQRTDPEVYDLYLRAKQRIYTRDRDNIKAAIEELDQAIQQDPDYAPAYAQRGIAVMLLSEQQYGEIPNDEATRRGRRFAEQALALDDSLAEGWAALGLSHTNTPGEVDRAVEPLERALALNPNNIDASNWLQVAMQAMGDYRGALDVLVDIAEKDPFYRPAFTNAIMSFSAFGMQDKAHELVRRMQVFDPDSPDLLLARAVLDMYTGKTGEGLQTLERYAQVADLSGVAKLGTSIGLLYTMQYERALEEGSQFFRPEALYMLDRKEEAFEQAHGMARAGYPFQLFRLYVYEKRPTDLVDYLEERWPSIGTFAEEVRGDSDGYNIMADIAWAYSELERRDRFDEAMLYLGRHMENLDEQGIDNYVHDYHLGIYRALSGEYEQALQSLSAAAGRGLSMIRPLDVDAPQLSVLAEYPAFDEIQDRMLANLNRDRQVVGLPPVNEQFEVVAETN